MQPRAFREPVASTSSQSVDSAFDPDCFDFAAYLGRRLGVDADLASEVLGYWLQHYERADGALAGREGGDEAPPRSNVHHARAGSFEMQCTGTDA